MRNRLLPITAAVAACLVAAAAPLLAADTPPPAQPADNARSARTVPPKPATEETVREIYVPFKDLSPILEGDPNRVLLSRQAYDDLLAKARKEDERRPPRSALLAAADYQARLSDGRAEITGTLTVTVLEKGLHAVGLDVAGVGLRSATLDGKAAPIGLADDGRLTLFVEGVGRHEVVLDVVAPLETTAARQILSFRLPMAPAARMRLTVPGDVEVKSGAAVVSRVFDEKAEVTRIEILPSSGDVTLIMTLNSRLLRQDRVVVARSVLLDEVTAAYERLHVTVSMEVLHRAVNQFRFAVPDGFDVTDVRSPNLARWAIAEEAGRRVLEIFLRDETTETVVLNLSAVRTVPDLAAWSLARLEPLDVLGHVSVVGLAVEDRLKAEALTPAGLIAIDTAVLTRALPATVLEARPGAAAIRPVAAYYAPQAEFGLSARIVRPPARLHVTTNLLAVFEDAGLTVHGGFALVPEQDKLFAFDFSVPAGWDVTAVTFADGRPIEFQRYEEAGGAGRIHVRLPQGVAPAAQERVFFQAAYVPKGWYGQWADGRMPVEFPVFAVIRAGRGQEMTIRDTGAIAVEARDDLVVRPDVLEALVPLDANEKKRYGLEDVAASLAYRYDQPPYRARLLVERDQPRLTAQTFSFFRVERDALVAHYEIVYEVSRARTRHLSLRLPADTPKALSIRGLDGVALKEYTSREVGEGAAAARVWTAMLAEPRRGAVRLAVDFEQRLDRLTPDDLALPVVAAEDVAYQSGLAAVEGSAELDVRVTAHPRKVDIGELVDAEYQPGRRLLGAYGFLGAPPAVRVSVSQPPGLALPPAIIQRAELATVFSADGLAQTAARFLLRTKSLFLEVRLPADSTLWSATLDGEPVKPRREGDRLLLNLPAGQPGQLRDLQIVYETPVSGLAFWSGVDVQAPRLFLRPEGKAEAVEVPAADLVWHLYPPTGYRVIRTEGSVVTSQVQPPPLAIANVAGALYTGTGGVNLEHGALGLLLQFAPGAASAPEAARNLSYFRSDFGDIALEPSAEGGGRESRTKPKGVSALGYGRAGSDDEARPQTEPVDAGALSIAADIATKEELAKLKDMQKPEGETSLRLGGGATLTINGAPDSTGQPGQPMGEMNVTGGGTFTGGTELGTIAAGPPEKPPTDSTLGVTQYSTGQPTRTHKGRKAWALEGLTSLRIGLVPTGAAVEFRSLGAEPRLAVTCVDATRLGALAWALGLAVFVVGLALTGRPFGRKAAYIIGVGLVATLLPVITGRIELALVVNGAFYAACLLIPTYLAAHVVRWVGRKVAGAVSPHTAAAAVAVVVLIGLLLVLVATAAAEEKAGPYVIQVVPPPGPVKVPADAIILPYDPDSRTGIKDADRLLVPYARYVELWNRAYPDKPLGEKPPPAPYALAGAALEATLEGEEYLSVTGRLDVDVFTDEYVTVPLPLSGGVLAKADLDGAPARVSVIAPAPPPPVQQGREMQQAAQQSRQQAEAQPAFLVVYVAGKGRHRLDVTVRMRLERQGGWRVADGHLPAAPATSLALRVPKPGTEVRLAGVRDKTTLESKQPDETFQTALDSGGALRIQWRPKVAEGQVDQTLTAQSQAVLDIQEDRLYLAWQVQCEFRHGEREAFDLVLPAGYTVEKVEGANVRGWEHAKTDGSQRLTVSLLKPAKAQETFTVTLWRQASEPGAPFAGKPFDVPFVGVDGALRHTGTLLVRRSPLMDVRTVSTDGVRRADLPDEKRMPVPGAEKSPLGIRPYQAYQFVATPFVVRLEAQPVAARAWAAVQTILRLAERERSLETQAVLTVEDRPLHVARLVIPDTLDLDRVQAPGTFEWAVTREDGRRILTVYLAAGVQGPCPIVVQGKLARGEVGLETPLPRIEVLDVARQTGQVVVQADPAFDVRPVDLHNIERVLMQQVGGWLNEGQKALAVLALAWKQPDYAGRLVLEPRKPDVSCFTVTNARVTDRSIDETILLAWSIKKAGIREVAFLLPAWMKEARISAPLLREKTVEPAGPGPDAPLRVRLTLQDQVMDELRVLVENDRLLVGEVFEAPIPVVETGRTDRRYVAIESAGRDEVVVEAAEGLEPLSRRQKEWAAVAGMLQGGTTRAFLIVPAAETPRLTFRTKRREAVATVEARIGLARTDLVMDSSGTYRGQVEYRIDNRTEQFLEIALPEGADLWTAVVAGQPVKPTRVEGEEGRVRIPIVKTAEGDLDYAVVLKYGGTVGRLAAFRYTVRFPLVRTLNIEAELGQVRLFVPEDYTWFDFDTPMTQAEQAGTLEAGVLAYQRKLAGRLLTTLQSDNPFAQMRAMSNLKQVGREILEKQQTLQSYGRNADVQTELSNAGVVIEQMNKQLGARPEAAEAAVAFNGDFLRRAYNEQDNRRDRNLVQDLGANWSEVPPPAAEPTQRGARFNDAWFAESGLENKAAEAQQAQPASRFRQQGGQAQTMQQAGQADVQAQISGEVFQQLNVAGKKGQQMVEDAERDEAQRRHTTAEVVGRYQKKLEERAKQETEFDTETRGKLSVIGVGGGGQVVGGFEGLGRGRGFFGAAEGAEAGDKKAMPEGLTSLDVQLPERGRVVEFTMPMPPTDLAIEATAASAPLIEGAERVAGVLVLVAVLAAVGRWFRGRTFTVRTQSVSGIVLIVLGVVGAFIGVFPLAGVLAVLVGLGIEIRLFFVRRSGAAAEPQP